MYQTEQQQPADKRLRQEFMLTHANGEKKKKKQRE